MEKSVDNFGRVWYDAGMELKEEILRKLDAARGEYFSGEQLAAEFGVSRSAVWKCIKKLEREGFAIASVKNRGYAVLAESDALSASGIEKFTGGGFSVRVIKKTGSTNDEAKALAAEGAPEWTAVIAEEQTQGRGRYQRSFYSPAGSGLYMSVILRPAFPASETLFITACAAAAVAEAIESVSRKYAEIKWVNDVFIGGKKVCGILTEAAYDVESGGVSYAVVGIGVNVKESAFPPEIRDTAGAVFADSMYPSEGRARLAAAILERLRYYTERIPSRDFYTEYKRRSLVIGKRVTVVSGMLEGEAEVLDLDENCFLVVRFDDGTVRTLSAGEVHIKLKN